MNAMQKLSNLYALNDAERFPCFHDAERESTLYYADFKVAEAFGLRAVWDTIRNCGDIATLAPRRATELYVVANHLFCEHYKANPRLARSYQRICDKIDAVRGDWSDEDKAHFFAVTD